MDVFPQTYPKRHPPSRNYESGEESHGDLVMGATPLSMLADEKINEKTNEPTRLKDLGATPKTTQPRISNQGPAPLGPTHTPIASATHSRMGKIDPFVVKQTPLSQD